MSDDIQTALDAGAAIAGSRPLNPDEIPLRGVVLPDGYRHQVIDLREYLDTPDRKRGRRAFDTHVSLSDYVLKHVEGGTVIYANLKARTFTAVLNAHETDLPGWCDHRAALQLQHTPAWQAWTGLDGRLMPQEQFAEHLETNELDIVAPPAATMLELAETFHATTKVNFKSASYLDSGQRQLVYEENVQASAGGKGSITIPKTFEIGIAPFEGVDAYRVIARLRYRIGNGTLAIGYQLVRPDDVIRAAFDDIERAVAEAVGEGVPIYRGAGD